MYRTVGRYILSVLYRALSGFRNRLLQSTLSARRLTFSPTSLFFWFPRIEPGGILVVEDIQPLHNELFQEPPPPEHPLSKTTDFLALLFLLFFGETHKTINQKNSKMGVIRQKPARRSQTNGTAPWKITSSIFFLITIIISICLLVLHYDNNSTMMNVRVVQEKQRHENDPNQESNTSLLISDKNHNHKNYKHKEEPLLLLDFLAIAETTGTDKVKAYKLMGECIEKGEPCVCKHCERDECKPWGHFYDTLYNRWLQPFSSKENVQFLEIGFYQGKGFESYRQMLPHAELHAIELSCENEAAKSPRYQELQDANRIHCGDASDLNFLHQIWTTQMKKRGGPDAAPPLQIVIDDASHQAKHMATSLFFWFPRIAPGGILVVEDIQPLHNVGANEFRTHILPQVVKDLHWCGDPNMKDTRCFPQLQPFLEGVHCEMHICVFIRNSREAIEPSLEESKLPADAFSNAQKCLFGPH